MRINWKVRLKSGSFWVAMTGAAIAFVYQVCGIVGVVPPVSEDSVTQLVGVVINLLVGLGIVVDPTTAGGGGSEQAMGDEGPEG